MKRYFFAVLIIAVLLICSSALLLVYTINNSVLALSDTVKDSPSSIVIIDAGHGGEDSGAVAKDGTLEKDINLEIALKLKEYLKSKDVLVVMTRESDCEIYDDNASTLREKKVSDIHNRMKLMNETENCIFISIHQNTFSVGKYSGTQVFYAPHTEYGSELAQSIQNSVVSEIQPDNKRQIKPCTQSVYLIYNAKKTAVLVECGFLSNEKELALLKNEEYQLRISKAIGDGIIDYLQKGS